MKTFRDRVAVVTGAANYIVPAQPEVKGGIRVRAEDLMALRNPTMRTP